MSTLIGELSNWYDYCSDPSGVLYLFGKLFFITFKFFQTNFLTILGNNNVSETPQLVSLDLLRSEVKAVMMTITSL